MARISEQETTLGHASSRAILARVIRSKASPGRFSLMSEPISTLLKALGEMRTEASQPSTMQSWKKVRRMAAAVVGLEICFVVTVSCMIWSNLGHDWA
ncbi:uncharacterized protein LOC127790455 [Diospyros lotus]|uniref:uncharacterized protein LOC127790455 n=1 Tax=Diospyros lotus TaxID=55363 RepID=UPI002257338E|nr:uncharacterized protein LOC127790455 [Diospyros lotus]